MTDRDPLVSALHEGRRRFLALVEEVRPELHRYCARMTGSVTEGEDIVQETLARAYYALADLETLPPLRPWLFQIAHNRALDHLRRYDRRMGQPLDQLMEVADVNADPEDVVAREEAVRAAISRFVELVPLQRSCVILKDVLGHSVEEIGTLLDLSVPAVKAALHRGRIRLQALSEAASREQTKVPRQVSAGIARYAALFNARDWDGVRAMLAEDVRLDVVTRAQRTGRAVSVYFTNYASFHDWRVVPAFMDGREILAGFSNPNDARPTYIIELTFEGDRVTSIRDFRHVPYIAIDAAIEIPAVP